MKKELHLIFETQVEHPHVLCDITKTKQILVNLISNAVKYTPAGRIGMSKELRDISCLPVFRRCHLVIFFECLAKVIDILKTDILGDDDDLFLKPEQRLAASCRRYFH